MNYSTLYLGNELLTDLQFFSFTIALLQCFSAFYEILTSDWLDDVIQSTAQYVTIQCKER